MIYDQVDRVKYENTTIPQKSSPHYWWLGELGRSFLVIFIFLFVYRNVFSLLKNVLLFPAVDHESDIVIESRMHLIMLITHVITYVTVFFSIVLIVKKIKKRTLSDYLALRKIPTKTLINWIFICLLLGAIFVFGLFDEDEEIHVVEDEEIHVVEDSFSPMVSYSFPVILIVVAFGPIIEELMFRGFMFEGMQKSAFGTFGTLLITSFLFTIVHFPREIYHITFLFLAGLLFGWVRYKTKSIVLPIIIHVLNNFFSMLLY